MHGAGELHGRWNDHFTDVDRALLSIGGQREGVVPIDRGDVVGRMSAVMAAVLVIAMIYIALVVAGASGPASLLQEATPYLGGGMFFR